MRVYTQSLTPLDRLMLKSVVGKDGGVVNRQPDTSVKATCRKCEPHATFIAIADRSAEDNLARHIADKHAKSDRRCLPTAAEQAAAGERAIDAVMDRIISGSLKPGRTISVTGLAEELGVTRYTMNQSIEHLIDAGMLRWSDIGSTFHRRVVVCPQ
jgi:hypothetical protein